MRRLVTMWAVFAICGLGVAASTGQTRQRTRPNFSGNWVLVSPVAQPDPAPLGNAMTIVQDDATVTVNLWGRSITALLDAPESHSTTTTIRGDVWAHATEARWLTAALLITDKTDAGAFGAWTDVVLLSFETGEAEALTVITLGTPKNIRSPQPAMIVGVHKYRRK